MNPNNVVSLTGNLGKDPELRRLEDGRAVVNVSMATSYGVRQDSGEWKNYTDWHDLVIWGERGERFLDNYKKGDKLQIIGRLSYSRYETEDGRTITRAKVVVNGVNKLQKSGGGSYTEAGQGASGGFFPNNDAQETPQATKPEPATVSEEVDDDLPF